jgi:hypothetical protein
VPAQGRWYAGRRVWSGLGGQKRVALHAERADAAGDPHPACGLGRLRGRRAAEDDFVHKVQRAGFACAQVLQREPLSIDDCTLCPPFSDEVIALMRRLIPTERRSRPAVAVVVKAFLPQMQ